MFAYAGPPTGYLQSIPDVSDKSTWTETPGTSHLHSSASDGDFCSDSICRRDG